MLFKSLQTRLRAFTKDTEGTVSVEAAIMFPILFWAFLAMFTFFDAYRQVGINQKAAYTIADMVSRETNALDSTYMDNALSLYQYLTGTNASSAVRISVIYYDNNNAQYFLGWSESRGPQIALTDAVIQGWVNVLPVLPESEALILIETWSGYSAPFNIGLEDTDLQNFIFASPRFASQLPWTS